MPQVQYPWQQRAERLAVAHHAAEGRAADVHAVIGALAGHEIGSLPLIAGEVIGERDLHRRVDRLGAGVAEEHMIQALRGERGDAVGEGERTGMAAHEGRREVERLQLLGDRSGYLRSAMAGRRGEEPGAAVQNLAPRRSPVVHATRAHEQARLTLELAVARERHPVAFQILQRHVHVGLRAGHSARRRAPRWVTFCQPKVAPISLAAACSRGMNSMARISGNRAVAPCTAIAAMTSPCRLRTGTATQATPSTYSSLSTA